MHDTDRWLKQNLTKVVVWLVTWYRHLSAVSAAYKKLIFLGGHHVSFSNLGKAKHHKQETNRHNVTSKVSRIEIWQHSQLVLDS